MVAPVTASPPLVGPQEHSPVEVATLQPEVSARPAAQMRMRKATAYAEDPGHSKGEPHRGRRIALCQTGTGTAPQRSHSFPRSPVSELNRKASKFVGATVITFEGNALARRTGRQKNIAVSSIECEPQCCVETAQMISTTTGIKRHPYLNERDAQHSFQKQSRPPFRVGGTAT